MSNTTEAEINRILDVFEQDLRLIATYNTIERQETSRDVAYRLADDALLALINRVRQESEELMGDAIIARYRQANGQWEKVESFIKSYQMQKEEDVHHIFVQLTNPGILNKEGK